MLEHQIFRCPGPDEALILAIFSYRYDAHLVPGLLENIRPGVHGYVAWDDRHASDALSNEPVRKERLFRAARDLGARWLLLIDPDERLEQGFARRLPDLIAQGPEIIWFFTYWEMFAPGLIRTDGPWGGKSRAAFLPVEAAHVDPARLLHGVPIAGGPSFRQGAAGINIYHLRMATPARRALRRDLYAAADPKRQFQRIGYDYLADERGMVLEPLPEGRGFQPPFIEDQGLWSPDPGALGTIAPDPYEVRFARAAQSAQARGQMAAHHVLLDLARDSPQDSDLPLLAACQALVAGAFETVLALVAAGAQPDALLPRLLRAKALVGLGRGETATDLAALEKALPGSPILADLWSRAALPRADLTAADAAWRALAPPDSQIREGADIAASDLATVVIGFRSQPDLLGAVQSLLDQDAPTEIVVVNTGGGEVLRDLAPVADRVRLITCETPLFVGAARNIGTAASRAAFVAYLAGDCRARPGWVAARLARHRAGAQLVASAVVVPEGSGLVAQAAGPLHYGARHPDISPYERLLYGLSYSRRLLTEVGQFPPGLATGEDTWLNRVARRFALPVWAPEVVTDHPEPALLRVLLHSDRGRGRRRAAHMPFRAEAQAPDPASRVGHMIALRLAMAQRPGNAPGLSKAERRAVLAMQWLAGQADLAGTLEGLADIAKARGLADAARACHLADPAQALALLATARQLDPQNPALAREAAAAMAAEGDAEGAEAALRAALALAPGDGEAAAALIALVADRDGPAPALALAEALALAAPTRARLWDLAAAAADTAGQSAWAVALGSLALALALDQPWAHQRLARWHGAAGNMMSAAFRQRTAERLQAVLDPAKAEQASTPPKA
jgi:GT2 family glycosyltransferase